MTLPICPACGLRQTLRAPRCARCGAPLEDVQRSYAPQSESDSFPHSDSVPAQDVPGRMVAVERWQRFWLRVAGSSGRPGRQSGQWSRWAPNLHEPPEASED